VAPVVAAAAAAAVTAVTVTIAVVVVVIVIVFIVAPPTVMEIIPRWTMSLIAASMIAFVVAAAPTPPSPVALADDAVGGVVPSLSSSSLW